MMDVLNAQNLKDTLNLQEKPEDITKKDWKKMNQKACGIIKSCLTLDLKYHLMNETSAKRIFDRLYRAST